MPQCPLHQSETLESKRKGWFCEECGAIVLSYDDAPLEPEEIEFIDPGTIATGPSSCPPRCAHSEATVSMPEVIDAAATGARERLRALAARGIPGLCYVERPGVDDVLASALERPAAAVLLIGEAGSGKTSLLARVVDRRVAALERGGDASGSDVVLVVEAQRLDGSLAPAIALRSAILKAAGLQPEAFCSVAEFLQVLAGQKDPATRMLLVIDGLDESPSLSGMVAATDELLALVAQHPWFRVVVALRSSSYAALPSSAPIAGRPATVFKNSSQLVLFYDDQLGGAVPFLRVRPFAAGSETRVCYELHQRRLPEQSAGVAFDALPRALQRWLALPWHQRLFHRAFAGSSVAPDELDASGVFNAFLQALCVELPGLERLLEHTARKLFESPGVEVPQEVLTAAAIATPPPTLMVRTISQAGNTRWHLVHARLAEQLLARELIRRIAPRSTPTCEELLAWARRAAGTSGAELPVLQGALEALVRGLAANGENQVLGAVLDIDDENLRRRLVASALQALAWARGPKEKRAPAIGRSIDALTAASLRADRALRLLEASAAGVGALLHEGAVELVAEVIHKLLAVTVAAACKQAQHDGQRRRVAAQLAELGRLALAAGRLTEARQCFEETVRIHTELLGGRPCIEFVAALRALGQVSQHEGDRAQAHRRLQESLRTSRESVAGADASLAERLELVHSLLALGQWLDLAGDLQAASSHLEEAVHVAEAILADDATVHEAHHGLAIAWRTLVDTARAASQAERATQCFEKAQRSMRRAIALEPQRLDWRRELAVLLNTEAAYARLAHQDLAARRLLEEAGAILRAVSDAVPHRLDWQADCIHTLNNLALLVRQSGRDDEARAPLEQAVQYARAAASRERRHGDMHRLLGHVLMNLAYLDDAAGRRTEARRQFREALEVMRAQTAPGAGRWEMLRSLAAVMVGLGRLAADDGDMQAARWYFQEALRNLSEVLAAKPRRAEVQRELAAVLKEIALLSAEGSVRIRRPPKHVFSVVVNEPGTPEVREYFDRSEITIGRSPRNELMLPNYSVSRHHARVTLRGDLFSIEDLDSKHGTRVSGRPISGRASFRAGDIIQLGEFTLRFHLASDALDDDWDGPRGQSSPRAEPSLGTTSEFPAARSS